jgi:hypothetical protein
MSHINLEAIKHRLEQAAETHAMEFRIETEQHFLWLDEVLPALTATLAASFDHSVIPLVVTSV